MKGSRSERPAAGEFGRRAPGNLLPGGEGQRWFRIVLLLLTKVRARGWVEGGGGGGGGSNPRGRLLYNLCGNDGRQGGNVYGGGGWLLSRLTFAAVKSLGCAALHPIFSPVLWGGPLGVSRGTGRVDFFF